MLETNGVLERDITIDRLVFPEGTPVDFRYGFDFWRVGYHYNFFGDQPGMELSLFSRDVIAMATAVAASPAPKLLLPLTQENVTVVGGSSGPLPHLVAELVEAFPGAIRSVGGLCRSMRLKGRALIVTLGRLPARGSGPTARRAQPVRCPARQRARRRRRGSRPAGQG